MNPDKWILHSMTVWGLIITFATNAVPAIGPWIGLDIDAGMITALGEAGTSFLKALGGFVGSIMVLLGRLRAGSDLTLSKPA